MNFTNSSLVNLTRISPNKNSGRSGADLYIITPHCYVGQVQAESAADWFAQSTTEASANYTIATDGRVVMHVEEKDRSWCTSSGWNDNRAITIECACDAYEPYAFNNAVYNKLVDLCVDICRRYNKKKLLWLGSREKNESYSPKSDEMILSAHRWYAAKSCPGEWFYSREEEFAKKVTELLGGNYVPSGGGTLSGGSSSGSSSGSGSYKRTDFSVLKDICKQTTYIKNDDISKKVGKLDEWARKNSDLTAWIYFKVNKFEFDTRKADTKTHYVTYFENQKTGAGQGNKFTIKIVFSREYNDKNYTINKFEEALATINSNAGRNRCTLQYGYLLGDSSPKYEGLLLQYDVTANKQLVEYTLYGVSGEQTSSLITVNWYPRLEGTDGDTGYIDMQKLSIEQLDKQNKDAVKSDASYYTNLVMKFNAAYKNPVKENPFEALCRFVYDYNEYLSLIHEEKPEINKLSFKVVDETGYGFSTDGISNLTKNLKSTNITICRNQTAIDYIQYLVSLFQIRQDTEDYVMLYYQKNKEIVDRFICEFKYDSDASSNDENIIKIVLRCIKSDEPNVAYTFTNYSLANRMLLDFTLKYDGTVALAARSNYKSEVDDDEDSDDNKIYIDTQGKLVRKATLLKTMFVAGSYSRLSTEENNTWLDRISCSNNATIKTIGMPFEIPVGTIFGVQSWIGDTLHHTSGNCYTVGVVDKIQNNMFTTELTLVRLPGKYGV